MKKILNMLGGVTLGIFCQVYSSVCYATDKFEILPDLPAPLAGSAVQASSVTTNADTAISLSSNTASHEPNLISLIFSMIFVILLIYATGIIYTKLNKVGLATLKKQIGENSSSQVAVVSTTALGNNKTLHVVELDGKRMLIGASASSIHLIKDLGTYPPLKDEDYEFSKIEIPNIRIPKIEIPKIEIPNIGFTKAFSKNNQEEANDTVENNTQEESDNFEISEIYEEDNPDGIIDKLFTTVAEEASQEQNNEHKVDPDEYLLYKKYLG